MNHLIRNSLYAMNFSDPNGLSEFVKRLFIKRMLPLVKHNFNLCEIAPRSTGKAHLYKEISPNSILVSGGQTTAANSFYNMRRKSVGLRACVVLDEAAGIRFKNKDGINCFWIPISTAIKNALRFSFPAWGMFKTLHTGRRQDTARIFTKLKARSARKEHLAFGGAADLQCILYSCAPPPAGRTKIRLKIWTGCRNLSIPGCAAYAAAWESMGKLMTASQNSFPQALKAYAPHKAVLCGKCLSKTPFQGIIFRE